MSHEVGMWARPILYGKQEEAIFNAARYAVIEASTKSGKTLGSLIWLVEQALLAGGPGQHYWWVAPTQAQARIAFDRLRRGYDSDNGQLVPSASDMRVVLPNGAEVWFKSAEIPDNLFGEDVWAAVLDEASRMREEAWFAVRSTLTATRGPVRVIGSVQGRRNWAYQLARRAEAGELDMHFARLTAYDAIEGGVLSEDEIEDARRSLPESVFRELYLAEPADDGGNPFGLDAIRACIAPLSDRAPVAWGWDLARAQDWTVGIGIDDDGHVCRIERFQSSWEDTFRRIVATTGGCRALVDSTGVGDPILERLQRTGRGFRGYAFTQASKQRLMEGLAVVIQQREVRFPEGVLSRELETFEYEITRTGVRYSAPAGLHDDCVIALALALEHRPRGRRQPDTRTGPRVPAGWYVPDHHIDRDTGRAPNPGLVMRRL